MGTFWQDLRYGARLAAARPGFTVVAVVALALGIGPNTAIFSAVNSLLLTPPPFADPGSIVTVAQISAAQPDRVRPTMPSTDDFQDWRRETQTLAQIALYAPDSLTLTGYGDPVRLSGARVSPALFPLLAVKPLVGRSFTDDEEQPRAAPVVIISYRLWDQKLGRDPAIVGKPLVLDGAGREVIGIMPPAFEFPNRDTEYWTPFPITPPERNPNERRVAIVPFLARLKPGVTIDQAAAEGTTIIARNEPVDIGGGPPNRMLGRGPAGAAAEPPAPEEAAPRGSLGADRIVRRGPGSVPAEPAAPERAAPRSSPGEDRLVRRGPEGAPGEASGPAGPGGPGGSERIERRQGGPGEATRPPRLPLRLVTLQERQSAQIRPALLVLWAAVGFVLLIACANVANLLLSRATSRYREISIRAALGAGRGRLVRQMLTESAIFSLLGGIAGVLLAFWMVRLVPRLAAASVPRLAEVRLDVRVLLFAALISLATTVLFGFAPALATARQGLAQSLKERAVAGAAGLRLFGRNAARSVLTITQVALALMLLVGAGLLTRSLLMLLRQDLGYRPDGALTVQFQLPRARYPTPQARAAFLDQVLAGVRSAPGVEAAGATNLMPMSQAQIRISFDLPGVPAQADPSEPRSAGVRLVAPGLFRALGTRLVAGREFADADSATGERVIIVNSAFATRYLPGLDAVGRQIDLDGPRRIVGLVESMRPQGLDSEPTPEMYFPLTQFDQLLMIEGPLSATTLVVRTSGDPMAVVPAVRAQVTRLDPQLPLFNITTLSQRVSDSVAQPRLYAALLGIFAGLALVLAAVGIYGVLSSQVAQSAREIGIQMALGARAAHIRRAVLGHGALLTAIGVALGLGGAWGLGRFVSSLLFGVTPFDPATYVGAVVTLTAAALVGAHLPSRRATAVDPVVALREE